MFDGEWINAYSLSLLLFQGGIFNAMYINRDTIAC